jgi:hypothetical protein
MKVRLLSLAVLVGACSSTPQVDPGDLDGGTAAEGGLVPAEGGLVGDGGAPPPSGCDESTRLVHVVTEERGFYRFKPDTATLELVGFLTCEKSGAMPTSMAIDRAGTAWVLYSDETLWKVDIHDASCKPTNYVTGQGNFVKFGMGFSTNSNGGSTEALFLSDHFGKGLASLDPRTLVVKPVGPYTGDLRGITSELTGTGDGKLYGFFVTSPAKIAEISKGTAEIQNAKELAGVYPGNAWAFAFWGGDFFLFTNASGPIPRTEGGSDITRYRPQDGSIVKLKEKIGVKVVGAGVSTCAPVAAPK